MQIKINLLPPELVAYQKQKDKRRFLIMTAGLILLLLMALYVVLLSATLHTHSEATKLQQETKHWQTQAQAYEQYSQLQDQMAMVETIVNQAMGSSPQWLALLAEVGLFIPDNVWLTDLQASNIGDSELTLQGLALDHLVVAAWLEEIEKTDGLTDVRLLFSAQEEIDEQAVVRFEIKAKILLSHDQSSPGAGDLQ